MKKNILIVTIVVLILIIGLVFFVSASKNGDEKGQNEILEETVIDEEVSETKDIENVSYKDFTIYREDNSEVKFSDYANTPIMLLFFDSKSEDSMKVLDKVEDMYGSYEDTIEFFMINTAEEIDPELKDKYTLEIYYDFYKDAAKKYNITEVPSMIYITENNEVFNAKSGITTIDALEANLDIISNNI